MTDVVDKAARSRNMSAIRGKDTKPELIVRQFLRENGYRRRYRLHRKDLPGKPDIVLPKLKLAIFVQGCFWHRHANCYYAATPQTRKDFWNEKLSRNVVRDSNNIEALLNSGWRVLEIWECGVKHLNIRLDELIPLIEGNSKHITWPKSPPRTR